MNTVQVNYLLITQVFFSDILKLLCTFNNHAFLSIVLHLFHLPVFSCVIILLSSFFLLLVLKAHSLCLLY